MSIVQQITKTFWIWFFLTISFQFSDVSVAQPLSTRDHSIVEFSILDDRHSIHSPASYDYAQADWKGMIESLSSVDWCSIFDSYICDELRLAFHAVLKSHLETLFHWFLTVIIGRTKFIIQLTLES